MAMPIIMSVYMNFLLIALSFDAQVLGVRLRQLVVIPIKKK